MVTKSPITNYIGKAGMRNKGNTCFFNSSIQALLSMPKFVNFFCEPIFSSKHTFSQTLQNFIEEYKRSKIIDPGFLIDAIKGKIKLFDGRQQDSHAFLESFISRLCDENAQLAEEKKNTLKRMLEIQTQDTVKCHYCGYKSAVETFPLIQYLFIKDSIQRSIDSFLGQEEQIDSASPWKCEKCGESGSASLSHVIKNTSDYLILYLNRFQNSTSKNDKFVEINNEISINTDVFQLLATVCHSGTLSGGHYYSFCKRYGEWNEYNDSLVKKSGCPDEGSQVYMLIYSKI
jgi:ubiquitin C-terminal hydrolase